MNLTPEKLKELVGILGIYPFIIFIQISFKGILYDEARKRIDSKYSGNHSFNFKNGKFRFSLPFLIISNVENNDVKRVRKEFNKIVIRFWIVTIILIVVYNLI